MYQQLSQPQIASHYTGEAAIKTSQVSTLRSFQAYVHCIMLMRCIATKSLSGSMK